MRFNKGFLRIWLSDMQRFFSQSPQDFAYFYYLIANAHYEDEPYWTPIKGSVSIKGSTKKEPYYKEWEIKKGDYFGSKQQIRTFWKFDNRTQQKILKNLAEKGLIEILLEEPALIIRIKNHAYFAWRGKSKDRPVFAREQTKQEPKHNAKQEPNVELHTPPMENNTPPNVELHTPYVILHPADIFCASEKVGGKQNYTQSHLHLQNHLNPSKDGGDSRAREEEAPPSQNVISFPKEKPPQSEDIENEIIRVQDELDLLWQEIENAEALGEVLPPERLKRWDELSQSIKDLLHTRDSNKKAPPAVSKDVRDLWHRHAKETFKTSLFPIEKYNTAIDEILSKTGYTENDIAVIFSHIVSGKDRLLTSRFKFPWEWNKSWESQNPESLNYLDEAYSSMNARKAKWK